MELGKKSWLSSVFLMVTLNILSESRQLSNDFHLRPPSGLEKAHCHHSGVGPLALGFMSPSMSGAQLKGRAFGTEKARRRLRQAMGSNLQCRPKNKSIVQTVHWDRTERAGNRIILFRFSLALVSPIVLSLSRCSLALADSFEDQGLSSVHHH